MVRRTFAVEHGGRTFVAMDSVGLLVAIRLAGRARRAAEVEIRGAGEVGVRQAVGVTVSSGRNAAVFALCLVVLEFFLYSLRAYPRALAVGSALVGLWALFAFTPLHLRLIVAMGHGEVQPLG